jgi:5,6-dimethylbenzimidazole synthase
MTVASTDMPHASTPDQAFSPAERDAVYRAIAERRDMRHFAGGTVAPEVMRRLLTAAHHAPSVGFMQPWRFVRVASLALRGELQALVEKERLQTAQALGERSSDFMRLKVEGLMDAAEVWVVALAEGRERHVFGRRTLPQMDLASVACAIQNLWLAARAEGLGMGWVSMFDPRAVASLLGMPVGAEPVAVLCIGPVHHFYREPMLQQQRWAQRCALDNVLFEDAWGQTPGQLEPVADSALPPVEF